MTRLITIGALAVVVLLAVGTGTALAQAGTDSGPAEAPTYIMDGPVEDAAPVTSPVGVSTGAGDVPVYVLNGPVENVDSGATSVPQAPEAPHFLL